MPALRRPPAKPSKAIATWKPWVLGALLGLAIVVASAVQAYLIFR